jgi:hypothetical protein
MLYLNQPTTDTRPPFVSCIAQRGDWAWQTFHAFEGVTNEANAAGGMSAGPIATTGTTATRDYFADPLRPTSITNHTNENPNDKTADEIILARIPTLEIDATATPCKKCGSQFRWRDCYSTASMHCDRCSKPPSLAMVAKIFGLVPLTKNGVSGNAWLEMTEAIKPIMQREQMAAMRNRTVKTRR